MAIKGILSRMVPSLEEAVTQIEREFVIFGKLVNPEQLKQAQRIIKQEQWEIKKGSPDKDEFCSSERVRKEIFQDGEVKFTKTSKVYRQGVKGAKETEDTATEAEFEELKAKATSGCYKTRYTFPTVYEGESTKWEVDVFYNEAGQAQEWVKMDLEVSKWGGEVPPYPVELTEVFDKGFTERTAEEQKYFKEVITKDLFINK